MPFLTGWPSAGSLPHLYNNEDLGPCSVSTFDEIRGLFFFLLVVAYLWFSLNKVVDLTQLRPHAAFIYVANYVYGLNHCSIREKAEGNT